jgi:hypothetical protein
MSRSFLLTAFFAFALQASQAQIFSHGIPAGATSPEPDGRQHGIPATVMSPTPLPFGVNPPLRNRPIRVQGPLRRFGTPAHHGRPVFVPVPLFYSYYTDGYPFIADPSVPEAPADSAAQPQAAPAESDTSQQADGDQALQQAYLQGARDALRDQESRYGEHYLDSRERSPRTKPAPKPQPAAAEPVAEKESSSPATVFIFKDGHQLETRNYAIMGQTLFDFSGKTLKKVPLDEIDAAATAKANDDRGVQVKLN